MVLYVIFLLALVLTVFLTVFGFPSDGKIPVTLYVGGPAVMKKKKRYRTAAWLTFLILGVFSALRDGVGIDYRSYIRLISMVQNGRQTYMETGFEVMCRALKKVSSNPRLVMVVMAFLTCALDTKFIFDNSENVIMSVFLFVALGYYHLTFVSSRNYFALAIVLCSIPFFREKKLFRAILIIIFASFFHKSALICIPAYLAAALIKLDRKTVLWLSLLLSAALLALKGPIRGLIGMFSSYGGYLGSVYDTDRLSLLNVVKGIGIIFISNLYLKKNDEYYEANRMYFNLNVLSLVVYAGLYWLPEVSRIGFYMNTCCVVLLPNAIESIENGKNKMVAKLLVYFFVFVLYIMLLITFKSPTTAIVPYQTWLITGW